MAQIHWFDISELGLSNVFNRSYHWKQWCILAFGSADVSGLNPREGVGGGLERPPARVNFSKTGTNTGPSDAF